MVPVDLDSEREGYKPINIFMSDVYYDYSIIAGKMPPGAKPVEHETSGIVVLGGTQVVTNTNGSKVVRRTGSDGKFDFLITPACKDSSCTKASLVGTITLSPLVIQDILNQFSGDIEDLQKPVPCVSGIAINGGHTYAPVEGSESTFYGAEVYLYMNNTDESYTSYAKASDKKKKGDTDLIQIAGLEDSISTAGRAL